MMGLRIFMVLALATPCSALRVNGRNASQAAPPVAPVQASSPCVFHPPTEQRLAACSAAAARAGADDVSQIPTKSFSETGMASLVVNGKGLEIGGPSPRLFNTGLYQAVAVMDNLNFANKTI